jgi:hypothetical protein
MPVNRHPVDELADVRAEIKRLEERESELQEALLKPGAELVGEEHQAHRIEYDRRHLDRDLLVSRFGEAAIAKCYVLTPFRGSHVERLKGRSGLERSEPQKFQPQRENDRSSVSWNDVERLER